jgi:RNA polymerase sigma-70 factor (ECF subfamily)
MEDHHMHAAVAGAGEATLADGRTFEEFYEANHRRLFTALCLVTGNRSEAEEIMQEAFLRLFERWGRVSGLDNADGYLFRAATNVFRNRRRRAVLALRRTLALAPRHDDLARVEERDEIVRLLHTLPPRSRAAIVLTSLLDYSSEDAARILGIRASSVRALATQARAQLRGTREDDQ